MDLTEIKRAFLEARCRLAGGELLAWERWREGKVSEGHKQ